MPVVCYPMDEALNAAIYAFGYGKPYQDTLQHHNVKDPGIFSL